MFLILLLLAAVLIAGYIFTSPKKPAKFPPGPKWLPFIGSRHVLQRVTEKHGSQWQGLTALAHEYSTQVLGLKLGAELVVVVYGEQNIRQVFTGIEFEGRPDTFFTRLRSFGKRMGMTFTDGPLWKIHRQFAMKQLRSIGFGKTAMEKEIQNELANIVSAIKSKGNPINLKDILPLSVMNILWKFAAGVRIEEERLRYLLKLMSARSAAFSMAGDWLNQMPWLRFVCPKRTGYSIIVEINKQISNIIEDAISKHKNKTVERNDFIYAFLDEMSENKSTFTEEQLKAICLDLLIAGSQTTTNVLEFALLCLLRDQVLQEKIYDEINKVIGDETPNWVDSYRLTYVSAFLMEVQRYYTIVPIAGPRRVLEDTVIDGYVIPKETSVLIAVGDLHFSPELWDDPQSFNPDRFIDENGALKNAEFYYPFGSGRRRCPGDMLAKPFVFIVLVGILQKYKIECCNGVMPTDSPQYGLLTSPKPFTASFVPRN